jgi:hypothetical protein
MDPPENGDRDGAAGAVAAQPLGVQLHALEEFGKGARPSDLSREQPATFEWVGHRKTADLLSQLQEGPIDPTNPFVALSR